MPRSKMEAQINVVSINDKRKPLEIISYEARSPSGRIVQDFADRDSLRRWLCLSPRAKSLTFHKITKISEEIIP